MSCGMYVRLFPILMLVTFAIGFVLGLAAAATAALGPKDVAVGLAFASAFFFILFALVLPVMWGVCVSMGASSASAITGVGGALGSSSLNGFPQFPFPFSLPGIPSFPGVPGMPGIDMAKFLECLAKSGGCGCGGHGPSRGLPAPGDFFNDFLKQFESLRDGAAQAETWVQILAKAIENATGKEKERLEQLLQTAKQRADGFKAAADSVATNLAWSIPKELWPKQG